MSGFNTVINYVFDLVLEINSRKKKSTAISFSVQVQEKLKGKTKKETKDVSNQGRTSLGCSKNLKMISEPTCVSASEQRNILTTFR